VIFADESLRMVRPESSLNVVATHGPGVGRERTTWLAILRTVTLSTEAPPVKVTVEPKVVPQGSSGTGCGGVYVAVAASDDKGAITRTKNARAAIHRVRRAPLP